MVTELVAHHGVLNLKSGTSPSYQIKLTSTGAATICLDDMTGDDGVPCVNL